MAGNGAVKELRVVLTVEDHAAALRLYRDILGLPVSEEFPGGTIFAAGKAAIEILTRAEAERADRIETGGAVGTPVRIGMNVADSTATGAALEAAGMKRVAGPVATPWGHVNVRLQTAEGIQVTLFTAGPAAPA